MTKVLPEHSLGLDCKIRIRPTKATILSIQEAPGDASSNIAILGARLDEHLEEQRWELQTSLANAKVPTSSS